MAKEVMAMSRISPLYGNIKLNCTIVSDTHIDIKHPYPWLPKWRLKQALSDAKHSTQPVDVFLTVGDTTSRGSDINWDMTLECFRKIPDAAKKIILPIGNHDGWHDGDFPAAKKNYLKYYRLICGDKIENTYFSFVVNGYYMIFLGTDSEAGCEAAISGEQIEWFRAEMEKAGASGKPIFVFCHQSLNQRHGLPRTWDKKEDWTNLSDGGIGERSDEIEAILKSQKNVYYFSGHSHMGIGGEKLYKKEGYASFEQDGDLTLINLPSLACGNHHGENRSFCIGMQLEVYEDKVVIRPRNHKFRTWLTSVSIKDGKPYFENKT